MLFYIQLFYVLHWHFMCIATSCSYLLSLTITTYVLVQLITKKQAVACPPQLFTADTLNTFNPDAADCHIRVCTIRKILAT